jgi:hypothetical protein
MSTGVKRSRENEYNDPSLQLLMKRCRLFKLMSDRMPTQLDELKNLYGSVIDNLEKTAGKAKASHDRIVRNFISKFFANYRGSDQVYEAVAQSIDDLADLATFLELHAELQRKARETIAGLLHQNKASDRMPLAMLYLYCHAKKWSWPDIISLFKVKSLPHGKCGGKCKDPERAIKAELRRFRKEAPTLYEAIQRMTEEYVRVHPSGEPTLFESEMYRQWQIDQMGGIIDGFERVA